MSKGSVSFWLTHYTLCSSPSLIALNVHESRKTRSDKTVFSIGAHSALPSDVGALRESVAAPRQGVPREEREETVMSRPRWV